MATPAACLLRFGVFELDTVSGELRKNGLKIRLPEQSFQVLKLLLSRPGDVVTREELQQVLWTSDTFVDFEVGLNSAVRKLREALDDSAENPRFVETLPRRGYRFVGPVAVDPVKVDADFAGATSAETLGLRAPGAINPPLRLRRGLWMAAGVVLVSMAAAAFVMNPRRVSSQAGDTEAPVRSLVVLPFENLTGDAAQAHFVDAVTDALTTHLAQVEGLDVISRTSARRYQRTLKRLSEIGEELNVDAVVEGSVGRSGSRVRVTAQLIRAATDRHIWAHSYDSELGDTLAVQQRIALDVAVAVGRAVPSGLTAGIRQVVDPQAYEAYVKGLTAVGVAYEDNRRAVRYFEEAIARQPDFAHAYAELASAQFQFVFSGPLSPRDAIPKAETAARKALLLDDTLARAHFILGQILSTYHWKWDAADEAFRRAAALRAPGAAASSPASRSSLVRAGRAAEAIAVAERARTLDPLSFNAQVEVGTAYREARQYARAVEEFRRALEMSPGHARAHFQLGATLVAMKRPGDAIRELEAAVKQSQGARSRFEGYLAYAFAAAGRTHDARRVLSELEGRRREQYVSSFNIALIHDALGQKQPALAALERAYEDHAIEFAQPALYPPFKTIASEPRYVDIMRQIGRPE
jgi:TolB-like protein/DNA-binding winged helix-turn-helix (wHTH) protein/tetratricopeptide (TPR) repeat protein